MVIDSQATLIKIKNGLNGIVFMSKQKLLFETIFKHPGQL